MTGQSHEFWRVSVLTATVLAIMLAGWSDASAASAQPPPAPPAERHPPPPPPPPPPEDDELSPPDDRERHPEPPPDVDELGRNARSPESKAAGRPRRAEELAALLFRPRPQDLGPLKPGEEESLLAFARERTPRICRALEWFRDRRPMVFRQRLSGMAPRLRQLKRIYERSPALGDALREHMEAMFELKRQMRVLGENEPGSALRDRAIEEMRELIATSIAQEHQALRLLADELDQRRDERADAWVDYLTTTGDADFPRLPEPVRELVRKYRAAASDAERGAIRDQMRERVDRFVAIETDALRERADRRKAEAAEEVDRRLKAFVEEGERPGPPDARGTRGPRPGRPPP